LADDNRADKPPSRPASELLVGLLEMLDQAFRQSEDCTAVLQRHLPNWDGKFESMADIQKLGKELDAAYPDATGHTDMKKVPDEVLRAMINLFITRWGGNFSESVTDKFGNLDPLQAVTKLWTVFTSAVDAKRKGGKTRAKVTPKVKQLAREIFANEKRGNVSDHAAYRRTSAKLKSHHDISVSAKTLKRHLEADESDNA
jgi:hypothetical protein